MCQSAISGTFKNILQLNGKAPGMLPSLVAVMPVVAVAFKVNQEFSQFFGGTSLLILVGVVLDTLQQIDSYLLMRKYDGLMSGGGKLKGRMTNQYSQVDF